MASKDVWRDYVVRKYVRARSASEAISLSDNQPVVEVNEMKDSPATSNSVPTTHAIGFITFSGEE